MTAAVFGCDKFSTRRFRKTIFVEIPILGFANTTQQDGGRGNLSTISPRPFTNAVSFITQKGTSEPILKPIRANSSGAMFSDQRRFSPRRTAAASLLPPPNPADTGIFLSIFILIPYFMLYLCFIMCSALYDKLCSSFDT